MDKKARAAATGRGITGVTMRHADERVFWWCTTEKFGLGSGGFNLGFGATEVRVVTINQVRECGRVKRTKNGADVESTDGEVCRGQDSIRCHKKGEKRREEAGRLEYAGERTAERLQSGCVGVSLTSHEVQGRISGKIWQESKENQCKKDKTAQMIKEMYR